MQTPPTEHIHVAETKGEAQAAGAEGKHIMSNIEAFQAKRLVTRSNDAANTHWMSCPHARHYIPIAGNTNWHRLFPLPTHPQDNQDICFGCKTHEWALIANPKLAHVSDSKIRESAKMIARAEKEEETAEEKAAAAAQKALDRAEALHRKADEKAAAAAQKALDRAKEAMQNATENALSAASTMRAKASAKAGALRNKAMELIEHG